MSVNQEQQSTFEELKKELLAEFQHMQMAAHRLINHLTAISGYTIAHREFSPDRPVKELHKVLSTVEQSMAVLRRCIVHLKELERRHS